MRSRRPGIYLRETKVRKLRTALAENGQSASGKLIRRLRRIGICGVTLLGVAASPIWVMAARDGDYTHEQANAGQQVYTAHCATCHGAKLQGGAGPVLAGAGFASNLSYSKMSARQLFDFIKSQMPADDPGSLSQQQYFDVLAYILSKNGYPAGQTALSQSTINQLQLLPYPSGKASKQSLLVGSPPARN